MSDRIYASDNFESTANVITVAQACRGLLTKRHFADRPSQSYDHVKYFNFYEVDIWSLDELYVWSKRLLTKLKCCLIRARIKDLERRRHVLRCAYDSADGLATLIPYRCNWFALDIDGYSVSTGDLETDVRMMLLALPSCFSDVECFAVASASYGIKTAIHLRLFFWSQQPVTNKDILRVLRTNKAKADLAIYQNPIQPIYTAAPIFTGRDDPVKQRMLWIQGTYATVNIYSESVNTPGSAENVYTKQEADKHASKYLRNISALEEGERHPGLIKWCIPLGKLVGQGHFEREDIIERAYNHCDLFWSGKRDTKKDMATIIYAIDLGIDAMSGEI